MRTPHRHLGFRTLLAATAIGCTLVACDPTTSTVCGEANEGNTDVPPTFPIEMGRSAGTFRFDYETRNAKDRVEVFYEGQLLFDSGCVGESRSVDLDFGPGQATHVDVVLSPNCAGTPMTSWKFVAHCPEAPAATFSQEVIVGQPRYPPRR